MSELAIGEAASGPLAGVRILEWGANFAAPLATMWLGDQGAEVTKIESPTGDTTRYATAHRQGVNGLAASFVVANRNKRSIVLDMKQPDAIDVIKALAGNTDVFVQNFRPGVVERFGLGYDDLKQVKSDIIFVSVSGFGTHGPYSKQRVWDPVVQAVSGMMSAQSDPETGVPCQMRSSVADKVTALVVAQAITAALLHRERTGQGQHVEVDMLGASLAFNWVSAMLNQMWLGDGVTEGANLKELRLTYLAGDGNYVCAIGISNPEWAALATALGRAELIDDPRFKENFDRLKRSKELAVELAPVFLTKSSAEWLDLLRAADVTCAPVNGPDNIHLDPQVIASKLIIEAEHPQAGRYRQTAHQARFRATPAQIRRHPPMLGENADAILSEAGFSQAQIDTLKQAGAVG